MASTRIKTCFISAPFKAKVDIIRDCLVRQGVRVLGLEDVPLGSNVIESLSTAIDDADLVVAVLTAEPGRSRASTGNVLFELGYAAGRGKQIVLFAPPKEDVVPPDLRQFLTVRTSLENREAIEFALSQVIAAPERSRTSSPAIRRSGEGLGNNIDEYIAISRALSGPQREYELEELIARAIRASGVELLAEPFRENGRVDLIVWSDDLQNSVGNPFAVEVKTSLNSRSRFRQATEQLARAAEASGAVWSLLIYGEAPKGVDVTWSAAPTVLTISVPQLFESMRHASFVEVVRDLRNRRAHGVG